MLANFLSFLFGNENETSTKNDNKENNKKEEKEDKKETLMVEEIKDNTQMYRNYEEEIELDDNEEEKIILKKRTQIFPKTKNTAIKEISTQQINIRK